MSAKRSLSEQVQSLSLREEESLDEAFDSATPRLNVQKSRRTMLPCDALIEYEDHNFQSITGRPQPFKEYGQKEMDELIESVKEHGVLQEITVLPLERKVSNSGWTPSYTRRQSKSSENHSRRHTRCRRCGSRLYCPHSNLQRHDLSYSERAWAYRMERDLRARQGKRTDLEETRAMTAQSQTSCRK